MTIIPFKAPLVSTTPIWLETPSQSAQAAKTQSITLDLLAGDIVKAESFGQGTNWLWPTNGQWVRFAPLTCVRSGVALFPPGVAAPDIAVNISGFPENAGGIWHGTYSGTDIILAANYYAPITIVGEPYTAPTSGQYKLASYWWAATSDPSGGSGNALCVAAGSQRLHGLIFRV